MANCMRLEFAEKLNIQPCAIGEPADFRNIKVLATYDDGTRDTFLVTAKMFKEPYLHSAGKVRTSTISYGGQKLSVNIPLLPVYLDRIAADMDSDFKYSNSESLIDRTKLSVTAFFNDGTRKQVDNYSIRIREHGDTAVFAIQYGKQKTFLDVPIYKPEEQEEPVQEIPEPIQEQSESALEIPAEPVQELEQPKPEVPIQELADPELPASDAQELSVQQPTTPAMALEQPPESIQASVLSQTPMPVVTQQTKTLVGVSVSKSPNKIKYLVNDYEADLRGGRLDLLYSDGTVGQAEMFCDAEPIIESKKAGTGHVMFTCLGKPVSFAVEILDPKVVRIDVAEMPVKTDYTEGDELDLTGLVLDVTYNDGSVRPVKGLECHDYIVNMSHSEKGVTLAFEDAPFTVPIHVEKPKPPVTEIGITFCSPPEKKTYAEGDLRGLDLTGAEISIQMSDGTQRVIPVTPDMVVSADLNKIGKTVLRVRYDKFYAEYPLEVLPKKMTGLEIAAPPQKLSYVAGEKFDLRGMILCAVYNNGQKIPVSDYLLKHDFAHDEDSEIVFMYQGLTAQCPITIQTRSIIYIDWAQKPYKTTYYTGETEFSCDGGMILIKRNDGTSEKIPLKKDMVSGFQTNRTGNITVEINHAGYMIPFSVTVQERILLGLQIVQNPRTQYMEGEEFDPTGMVVKAMYSGGTSEYVGTQYIPVGPLNINTNNMILIYKDKAAVLTISVHSRASQTHQPFSRPAQVIEEPIVPELYKEPDPVPPEPVKPSEPVKPPPEPVQSPESAGTELEEPQEPETEELIDFGEEDERPKTPPICPVPDVYPSSFDIRFEKPPEEEITFEDVAF